jgi:hypothetical protein
VDKQRGIEVAEIIESAVARAVGLSEGFFVADAKTRSVDCKSVAAVGNFDVEKSTERCAS